MSKHATTPALSPEFIEQQRLRLQTLRAELLGAEGAAVTEVRIFHEQQGVEAQEFEDVAQDEAREEVRQALHDVDKHRVDNIERALRKIEQGELRHLGHERRADLQEPSGCGAGGRHHFQ